jgi:hypothetical protein
VRVPLLLFSVVTAGLSAAAAQPEQLRLEEVLSRAGARVQEFFRRAQSLICLETVRLMPLTAAWGSSGLARTVESELRLSWEPGADGVPPGEARVLRQVLRVNRRPPRKDDWYSCTEPEQESSETQPLSLLLPANRDRYDFKLGDRERVNRREVITVEYRDLTPVATTAEAVEGHDSCISYNFEGGIRGRMWIDAETFDVLRLDSHLIGMIDIPLPDEAARGPGPRQLTLERYDTTVRFERITFTEPDETLVLPVSTTSLRITRGSGTPRLRTSTEYSEYRRFLTSGRIVR